MLMTVCLYQVVQNKQYSTFAQSQIEENTNYRNNQAESEIATVALNEFTFIEYLKTAAKAYLDPQGLSDEFRNLGSVKSN